MAIIGSSLPRLGAIERVTGAQQYAADVRLDNTLHVKLVSVDCAHARIVAVHKDEALRVPGVRGVFTAHDLPQPVPRYGPVFADRPMLAVGETKFSGEPGGGRRRRNERMRRAARRNSFASISRSSVPSCRSRNRSTAQAPLVQDTDLRPDDPTCGHEHASAVAVRMGQRGRRRCRSRHRA
jgi:xanthine dehydrogenase molybdopterin-binding subunit B